MAGHTLCLSVEEAGTQETSEQIQKSVIQTQDCSSPKPVLVPLTALGLDANTGEGISDPGMFCCFFLPSSSSRCTGNQSQVFMNSGRQEIIY